jgi:drug/metabolite transporter (DMT)-like permease
MTWFWLALVGPILWALTNHIDKHLLTRYFADRPTSALILISSFAGLLVAVPVYFFVESVLLPLPLIGAFLVVGVLSVLYLYPYFAAMGEGEVSMVAPLFQLIPIFYFGGAYFLLGETLSLSQFAGCGLLILGGVLSVLNIRELRWEWDIFFFMLISSILLAAAGILFKYYALDGYFWEGTFWQSVGSVLFALFLLVVFPSYRATLRSLGRLSRPVLGLNIFNEGITLIGYAAMNYASLLVPITLAQSVNGFQPLFVFLWGAVGVSLFPRLGIGEDLSPLAIAKKLSVAVLLIAGAWMLR